MTERSLFVIGAGASKEFQLPTGSELISIIRKFSEFEFDYPHFMPKKGSKEIANYITHIINNQKNPQSLSDLYFRALRDINSGLTLAPSIDHFLNAHGDQEHLVHMGKICIAHAILEAERNSLLYISQKKEFNFEQGTDFSFIEKADKTWISTFCRILFQKYTRKNVDCLFDDFNFIIFNYDRCVEHFLPHAVSSYYKIPLKDAFEIVVRVDFIHPYGSLGRLPWQDNNEGAAESHDVAFGLQPSPSQLRGAANSIRTFMEQGSSRTKRSNIARFVSEAEQVFFLGFGYHDMNIKILEPNADNKRKKIYGTAVGISEFNLDVVKIKLRNWLQTTANGMGGDVTLESKMFCNDLIYNYSGALI